MSLDAIPCDLFVDISGCDFALPSSKLNDAVAVLQPGQTLMAVSEKHALLGDIADFCRQHELLLTGQGEMEGMYYYLIQSAAG